MVRFTVLSTNWSMPDLIIKQAPQKGQNKEHCMCIKQKQNISSPWFLRIPSTLRKPFEFECSSLCLHTRGGHTVLRKKFHFFLLQSGRLLSRSRTPWSWAFYRGDLCAAKWAFLPKKVSSIFLGSRQAWKPNSSQNLLRIPNFQNMSTDSGFEVSGPRYGRLSEPSLAKNRRNLRNCRFFRPFLLLSCR